MENAKKRKERKWLDVVLSRFGIDPGLIVEGEEPDFLSTLGGETTGIEVTEIYMAPSTSGAPPMQAYEGEERLMVKMARKKCLAASVPPQQVSVRVRRRLLSKTNRERVASSIAAFVSLNYAAPGEFKSANQIEEPFGPEELVYIQMYGLPLNSLHQWHGPCSGWVNSDFRAGMAAAVQKKEARLPAYFSRCEKCWLIMVATGEGGSSFIELPDDLVQVQFATKFHRLFFVEGLGNRAFELSITRIHDESLK
jgi:hypothetical protein